MKFFLIGLFAFTFFGIASAQDSIDVLHYKFALQLNDRNDTVYGQAEIKVKFIQSSTSFSIDLLSQNKQGKGMMVDAISCEKNQVKNFAASGDKWRVLFLQPTKANDTITITVNYHGVPFDGLIISKNHYGERTFFADNWPNRAHNWIPCLDQLTDKASFEFMVTAPSHYKIISNGILIEEKALPENKKLTHWKEDTPSPTKVMVIGAADFAVKRYDDSPPNIPVSAWVFKKDSIAGFGDYAYAPSIVKFYSSYVAPYPYKKLANVQSKTIFGGMENANAIFYAETSVDGRKDQESLMAHEIAHQWFGDMASEKSFAHLWLSEGFATYLTHIYMESKYGTDSLNHEMQNDRYEIVEFARTSSQPVVDSVSPYMRLLNANSYQKGSWVLHMLRRQLGDSIFKWIISTYYDTYKGKNADTKDFEAIAEKISGKNLQDFFKQWLYTPGIPGLVIDWSYLENEKRLTITVEQKTEPFRFPLEILIKTGDQNQTVKLNVSQKTERFTLQVSGRPEAIIADPNTSLLYDGSVKELK